MLNYSDRITSLMRDVVARVPSLSYINMAEVLVFGRFGRVERRRRICDLSLSESSRERARLLLLARSAHRPRDAAIRMVRHEITDRAGADAADQLSDLVCAAALL